MTISRSRRILVIGRDEFRRALESRWLFGFTALLTALVLGLSFFGLAQSREVGFQGFARVTLSLMNLVLFVVPLVGLTLGVTSLTGGGATLPLLLAQPVGRGEVLLGKFVGLAAALTVAQAVGFGAGGALVAFQAGADQVRGFMRATGGASSPHQAGDEARRHQEQEDPERDLQPPSRRRMGEPRAVGGGEARHWRHQGDAD